jgi:CubicO group peptidase (beta-lactamase class C family)
MIFRERLNQLLIDTNKEERFSGVVLIQRDDDTLFEAVHGYANRSWKVKNQLDTRFRIASISKMFTAVAVLQLIDEGKLALDSSVIECLDLRNTKIPKEATVYHMLTMTSGIADWFDESGDWEEEWADLCRKHPIYLFRKNEDYLPLFVDQAPIAPVGEKHQYNGAGYILLGLVIERLSGVSYFDYVRRHIFTKAQMLRSDFIALDDVYDEVATGYISIQDENENIIGWKKNIYSTTPEAAADGGATSTAVDLVKFCHGLRNGLLLSTKMTEEMLTPKVIANEEQYRGYIWKYGYSNFFILDQDEQIVRWGHTGEEDGVSCRLYYYPKENLDVVILANQSWSAGSLGWKIHDLIGETTP